MFDPLSKCDLKCLTGINLHEDARTDVSAFLVKYFTLLLWICVHYLFYYFLLLIFFSLIKPKSLPIYKKKTQQSCYLISMFLLEVQLSGRLCFKKKDN